jgi:uncharacterized protein (TIGR03437 family)
MPVSSVPAGLLTEDFPVPQLHPDFADAVAYNQDGTPNDIAHPTAAGSTITLFATGVGATDPQVAPASLAQSEAIRPVAALSWRTESGASRWRCYTRSSLPASFHSHPM